MTTIRTLHMVTRMTAELEQASRAMGSLALALQAAAEAAAPLAETAMTYTALYGTRPCRAITSDGRWFTVLLNQDPGYGSMIFGRIYMTELTELTELDEEA